MVRAQSWEAGRDRAIDRLQAWFRTRGFERGARRDSLVPVHRGPPQVLNISPLPPFPRRGGAQIQLFDRLSVIAQMCSVAVVYPLVEAKWRLEWWDGPRRVRFDLEPGPKPETAVLEAARMVGVNLLHLENTASPGPDFVARLAAGGFRTIFSVHDYSVYCRRPHLMEEPAGRFCDFSTDDSRCVACLRQSWEVEFEAPVRHRSMAAASLGAAEMVVFPSAVARDSTIRAFAGSGVRIRSAVIPPATTAAIKASVRRHHFRRDAPHIGFVGGLQRHKGAHLIRPTIAALRGVFPEASFTVYGDGDHEWARGLRVENAARVRGYYRAGFLPSLLAHDGVDVAVFPSVWPETYGLVVDECMLAGVPVVAFDIGAAPDRLPESGAGISVALGEEGEGLARACLQLLRERPNILPQARPKYTVHDAAREHLELYRQLGSAGAQ
jgi:glycosyltransferase involved in cell wall biosynthesis